MTTPPHPPPAGDQDGIATVEFTAVVWLFLVIVLGAVQFGLWWHAQHVVLGAAQDAARLVAADGATAAAGRTRARELLQAGLGRDAATAEVQVRRGLEVTQVTVSARLRPLLPIGGGIRLAATANSHTERFRPGPAAAP
jgi:Flp pilus assembly protein TadG